MHVQTSDSKVFIFRVKFLIFNILCENEYKFFGKFDILSLNLRTMFVKITTFFWNCWLWMLNFLVFNVHITYDLSTYIFRAQWNSWLLTYRQTCSIYWLWHYNMQIHCKVSGLNSLVYIWLISYLKRRTQMGNTCLCTYNLCLSSVSSVLLERFTFSIYCS